MSTLGRYQKSGGFLQLITLLETSAPEKRQKFLSMIREESPLWAEALEKKILTFQRVLSWNDSVLFEVLSRIQVNVLSQSLHGFDEKQRTRIFGLFPSSQKRKMEDAFAEKSPTPGEINSVMERVLSEIRKVLSEGAIKLEKIDPEMAISDGIEEQLKKQGEESFLASKADLSLVSGEGDSLEGSDLLSERNLLEKDKANGSNEELVLLKKKLHLALQENQILKTEVSRLRTKLEQIRKAAA